MTKPCARFILVIIPFVLSEFLLAQTPTHEKSAQEGVALSELIWRDPGDIASLDLIAGAGGPEHAPNPEGPFTFVKEDLEGTNPKFDVTDAAGVTWRVKLGEESRTEIAASRLMWAAGYFVDEDYYLPQLAVRGLPKLGRGQDFVSPAGTVNGAGLKRRQPDAKKAGHWDWFANPLLGTREENGLRIMMALLNNWDLKQINNSIIEIDGERRYMVSDLGATLGRTGNYLTRSKGAVAGYDSSPFVRQTNEGFTDFVVHSRPFALTIVRPRYYRLNTRMADIVRHIPTADARWLGDRLSRLSDAQLRDCFTAAGYATEDVERYAVAVKTRIAALNALRQPGTDSR